MKNYFVDTKLLNEAEKGDAEAQLQVALQYEFYKDFEKAFNWYKKATETDDKIRNLYNMHRAESVYRLGLCYLKGIGIRKNSKKALECFKKADINIAREQIGLMYRDGIGVTKDIESACWYLEKAGDMGLHGDKGLGSALYTVSQIYWDDVTTGDNFIKYMDSLKKAYELDDENAISDLSEPVPQRLMGLHILSPELLNPGTFFDDDDRYRDAALWLTKAAEQGDSSAQYELGVLYSEGKGMTRILCLSIY